MPGTLDLDFMRVKRKTRSHPTSPKGSPTRTSQNSSSTSQNESEASVHNSGSESGNKSTKPRKSSDDGRYLFLAKPVQPEILTQRSSSTPSTPVTGSDLIPIDNPPQRSKSVRAFVELFSNSDSQKIIEAISTPKKEASDANSGKRRVSRVCVILNDAELLVVSFLTISISC